MDGDTVKMKLASWLLSIILLPIVMFASYGSLYVPSISVADFSAVEAIASRPEVRFEKWGESMYSVRYAMQARGTVLGSRMDWHGPDRTMRAYPLPAKDGMEHGGFEIDLVLRDRPASNVFEWELANTENLNFYYQPALTPSQLARGMYRAENVVGSYAVYHKFYKNHRVGGINYETGKVGHAFRPEIIDETGRRTWCDLNITASRLRVTCPQAFIDTAIYPVIVDPTFGYTTIGGTSTSGSGGDINTNYLELTASSPAGTNTLTNLSVAFTPGATDEAYRFGWYSEGSDIPVNRLVYDVSTWTPGSIAKAFYTNPVAWSYALAASTKYWAAEKHSGNGEFWFDSPGTGQDIWYRAETMPATVGASPTQETNLRVSAYATYTIDEANQNRSLPLIGVGAGQ